METTISRSDSPLTKTNFIVQEYETVEYTDEIDEPIKNKKKSSRNKVKTHINGKESEDSSENGNEFQQNELIKESNQIESTEIFDTDINQMPLSNSYSVEKPENGSFNEVANKLPTDILQESSHNGEQFDISKDVDDVIMIENKNCNMPSTIATEAECSTNCSPDVENSTADESELTEGEILGNTKDEDSVPTNGQIATEIPTIGISEVSEISEICVNGSDEESFYEVAEIAAEDKIQASPDIRAKEEYSFSDKISTFLGKWNISPTSRGQNFEISSSKKSNDSVTDTNSLSHPYLSKVTGRRGIKTRSNYGSPVTNGMETETPKNKESSLSDSFRVKTDPPRLNKIAVEENSVLRKFKGKRCLNVNDEYEDGEEMYMTGKRIKLDDKNSKSGILGGILWSPFKKKPLKSDEQLKLPTTQSKLSRFLSPFWFWKKTTTEEEEK